MVVKPGPVAVSVVALIVGICGASERMTPRYQR